MLLTRWKCGWVAMRMIRAPDSEPNSWSWNCTNHATHGTDYRSRKLHICRPKLRNFTFAPKSPDKNFQSQILYFGKQIFLHAKIWWREQLPHPCPTCMPMSFALFSSQQRSRTKFLPTSKTLILIQLFIKLSRLSCLPTDIVIKSYIIQPYSHI